MIIGLYEDIIKYFVLRHEDTIKNKSKNNNLFIYPISEDNSFVSPKNKRVDKNL